MHERAVLLVLLSAILHATWNAQLKGGNDRTQFMAAMSTLMGIVALLCVPFVSLPDRSSWWCIGVSGVLHLGYNLLLLENYRKSDFSSVYPIARGTSPLLVTAGAFFLMRQHPTGAAVAGIAIISFGIVLLSTERAKTGRAAVLSAIATGGCIAAYTVVDGMGVQRSHHTLGYTAWVFASYLLMPAVLLRMRQPVGLMRWSSMGRPASAAVCSLAAYTLVLWATQYVDVGIVSALRETSVLWALVIGRVFLGEPFTWRRLASASMICVGIALLMVKFH